MRDFKWPVTMPGSCLFQVPVERFMGVGGPASFSLEGSLARWSARDRQAKSPVTWRHEALPFAGESQGYPASVFRFLFRRFIVLDDEFLHQHLRRFRDFAGRVSSKLCMRQEA